MEHGGHLHDDPHAGTRLSRARDVASQHPEGDSVRQVYVVRCGGVPEAAADVDGARQFKWLHVLVEGIQYEIRGSCCYEDVQLGRLEAAQRVNSDDHA